VLADYTVEEELGDGSCFLVPHGHQLDPLGKVVDHREDIDIPLRRSGMWTGDVDSQSLPRLTSEKRLEVSLVTRTRALEPAALVAAELGPSNLGRPPWPVISLLEESPGAAVSKVAAVEPAVKFRG